MEIDAVSAGGETPLHEAAACGNSSVVRALLQAGASAQAGTSAAGHTPMHAACMAWGSQGLAGSDAPEVVQQLLSSAPELRCAQVCDTRTAHTQTKISSTTTAHDNAGCGAVTSAPVECAD